MTSTSRRRCRRRYNFSVLNLTWQGGSLVNLENNNSYEKKNKKN